MEKPKYYKPPNSTNKNLPDRAELLEDQVLETHTQIHTCTCTTPPQYSLVNTSASRFIKILESHVLDICPCFQTRIHFLFFGNHIPNLFYTDFVFSVNP